VILFIASGGCHIVSLTIEDFVKNKITLSL